MMRLFPANRKPKNFVPNALCEKNKNVAVTIEWALVVPWITRENLLLMFLVYRWRCSCSRMLPTSKRDAALVTSFD
jgi:hypothetical protein